VIILARTPGVAPGLSWWHQDCLGDEPKHFASNG